MHNGISLDLDAFRENAAVADVPTQSRTKSGAQTNRVNVPMSRELLALLSQRLESEYGAKVYDKEWDSLRISKHLKTFLMVWSGKGKETIESLMEIPEYKEFMSATKSEELSKSEE